MPPTRKRPRRNPNPRRGLLDERVDERIDERIEESIDKPPSLPVCRGRAKKGSNGSKAHAAGEEGVGQLTNCQGRHTTDRRHRIGQTDETDGPSDSPSPQPYRSGRTPTIPWSVWEMRLIGRSRRCG
ncbi:uncharacterized protein P884DRAFT_270208 [Thermothelomyces heterothallicus CBS 202.75]|uniref:uncharacterized protein n=1 Tax=Thermothelomyces heterothallicus CBS 202.75 TaxID=1149848 RepID=UPI0037432551